MQKTQLKQDPTAPLSTDCEERCCLLCKAKEQQASTIYCLRAFGQISGMLLVEFHNCSIVCLCVYIHIHILQILITKTLEQHNVWYFALKNDFTVVVVVDYFSADSTTQLTECVNGNHTTLRCIFYFFPPCVLCVFLVILSGEFTSSKYIANKVSNLTATHIMCCMAPLCYS